MRANVAHAHVAYEPFFGVVEVTAGVLLAVLAEVLVAEGFLLVVAFVVATALPAAAARCLRPPCLLCGESRDSLCLGKPV